MRLNEIEVFVPFLMLGWIPEFSAFYEPLIKIKIRTESQLNKQQKLTKKKSLLQPS